MCVCVRFTQAAGAESNATQQQGPTDSRLFTSIFFLELGKKRCKKMFSCSKKNCPLCNQSKRWVLHIASSYRRTCMENHIQKTKKQSLSLLAQPGQAQITVNSRYRRKTREIEIEENIIIILFPLVSFFFFFFSFFLGGHFRVL